MQLFYKVGPEPIVINGVLLLFPSIHGRKWRGFSEVITPLRGVIYLSLLVGAHRECFRILLLIYTSGFCLIVDAWNAWTLHYDERKVDCDMAQFDMLGCENWMVLPSLLELLMSCKLKLVKVQYDVSTHFAQYDLEDSEKELWCLTLVSVSICMSTDIGFKTSWYCRMLQKFCTFS